MQNTIKLLTSDMEDGDYSEVLEAIDTAAMQLSAGEKTTLTLIIEIENDADDENNEENEDNG